MKCNNLRILKKKIKNKIRNHKKIYSLFRCFKSWYTDEFCKLIFGYYDESNEFTSIMIKHGGELMPDKIIYHILFGDSTKSIKETGGFFMYVRRTLEALNVSEYFNAVPVVEWGKNVTYYDKDMDNITQNVFEYFFEPVSDIKYINVSSYRNIINSRSGQYYFFLNHASSWGISYEIEQSEIIRLAELYKKYIKLNAETDYYIKNSISKCLNAKKTLGIHIRGTDYNVGYRDHPNVIDVKEYICITKEIFDSKNYDQIFLATDDTNVLKTFKEAFENKVVYYDDTLRSSDNIGVHGKYSARNCHYYKLGLEVLRDVYTLANCDSLICGLSQVAFAARYIRISMEKNFDELKIVNHGIRKNSGKFCT